jgi:hypothetical protein
MAYRRALGDIERLAGGKGLAPFFQNFEAVSTIHPGKHKSAPKALPDNP